MINERIYTAINKITPREDAEKRMYARIREKSETGTVKTVNKPRFRSALPLAFACSVALFGVVFLNFYPYNPQTPLFLQASSSVVNPDSVIKTNETITYVFNEEKLTVVMPIDAENVVHEVTSGVLRSSFSFHGRFYELTAAKRELITDEPVVAKEKINDATLYTLEVKKRLVYEIKWKNDDAYYALRGEDAAKENLREIVEIIRRA